VQVNEIFPKLAFNAWVKPRIKLINTYLEADVGNILAQDIMDILAKNFEVVALKPCRGEINYEQIAGMEDLDDKMRGEILACEGYKEQLAEKHRRGQLTSAKNEELKQYDRDIPKLAKESANEVK